HERVGAPGFSDRSAAPAGAPPGWTGTSQPASPSPRRGTGGVPFRIIAARDRLRQFALGRARRGKPEAQPARAFEHVLGSNADTCGHERRPDATLSRAPLYRRAVDVRGPDRVVDAGDDDGLDLVLERRQQ